MVIEQDRHLLRRKLVTTQAECDTRLLELQADLRDLQAALNERDTALKNTEKEKAVLISELSEQNQRLTNQIKESARNEEQLSLQLQGLRDQYSLRKSSLQDHQTSLDVLRDEILFMSEKKLELERRVQMLQDQRDNLSSALEEATDRVLLLERETREQQIQLQVSHRELEELRSANGCLGDRLEAMGVTPPGSSGASGGHRSLLSEMECDEHLASLPLGDDLHQMKVEIVSVYDRAKRFSQSLKHRANHSDSSIRPDITVHQVKVGLLTTIINELSDLINEIGGGDYSTSSVSVTDLEIDLHRAQEAVDRMTKEIEAKSEELKRRNETIVDLSSKLNIKEAELVGAVEERDRARADLKDAGGLARDEMVRKAWEVRDGAVARKNATQVELAKTRIDMIQANSQLLEAIQQKVELSQQLEQWQMDMQSLLDEQMRLKLGNPELPQSSGSSTPSSVSNPAKRPSRKLFGIFQR
ncbi:hypothetical protein LSTR_LSTR004840 [Laodelphax striatellus]|uniref:Bicaudal D-related protein homolog n=1 Tax=Laodelphax striatellus TaxID=195883 RepID=A0A482WI20_LAOST|nr:hypothetical protein LSTR_LSTR004840 [Laodelphax striatellus]